MRNENNDNAVKCGSCKGNGNCIKCDGEGIITLSVWKPGEDRVKTCVRCGGSGICPGCRGSGWIVTSGQ